MDSGLEERILPSIRRSQIVLIYHNAGVVNPETFGQIACAARTPARSVFRCRARLRAPWILDWQNVNSPQSANQK